MLTATEPPKSWRASRVGVLAVASLAVFIDMLLYGIIIPIQPRLLAESGVPVERTDFCQATLFASYAIGLFISTPVFGVVSDHFKNRQLPMLCGLLALAVSTVSFAFLRTFNLLLIARFAQGISAAATWVVGFAMVADAYPSDDGLGFAVGLVLSFHTVGSFVGPLVGGFIGEYFGLSYPFLICAFLAIVDLIGRLIIRPPIPVRHGQQKDLGFKKLLCDRNVPLTLVAILIISSSFSSIELYIASWLENEWHFSESRTSLFMLAFILPNMVMAVLVGWISDRLPRHRIIAFGLVLHGLAAPLIPLSKTVGSLITFSIIFGVTVPIVGAPLSPHLANVVESMGGSSYARVYALFNMTYSLGMIAGPWAIGTVKHYFGFAWGMSVISFSAIIFAPLFLLGTKPLPKKRQINLDDATKNDFGTNLMEHRHNAKEHLPPKA